MANSLLIGVSALRSNQEMLDVVGNDLANANTTGFKDQQVRFGDVLYQTLKAASGSTSANIGGTNPIQAGFGVKVQSIESDLTQGSLETTGNNLDMALQGNGFFVTNNGTQDFYTRAGSFGVDDKGFLVDPSTGFHVQRFGTVGEGSATSPAFQIPGNNSIKIPFGTGIPGQSTQTVTLQGNLSASAVGPLAQTLLTAQPFLSGGAAATSSTTLNSLDDNTKPYQSGDNLLLQGNTVTGASVNATVPVGPSTTLGDLISAINTNFPGSTASLDASGNLVFKANATGPAASLNLTISDAGPNGATSWINHGLTVTTVGKDGDTMTSAIQVFDSQGTAHNLSLVFQKQGNNNWSLSGSIPAADGTVTSGVVNGITFNQDGSFQGIAGGPGNGVMTIQFQGLTRPQTVHFDFGTTNGFNGLTQFGSNSSAAAIDQDGYAAGLLTTVAVDKDGTINGVFTNGRTFALGQLAVANFANSAGLSRDGQNMFELTTESGVPMVGAANSGGRGTVEQGALEGSNVDVSLEFTQMIVAERGFQVNARTITVSDQVLQELANIIR